MTSAPWDNAARQRYKEYTQLLIALVLGAIVLLPTLVGLSKPPVTWPWAVPVSILLLALSAACLGVALVACVLEWTQPPFIPMGLGFFTAIPGLLLLLVYAIANAFGSSSSEVRINAITASPIAVAPGKYVEVDVDASDKDGGQISYRWTFQNQVFSTLRNGYLKAPSTPGLYPVNVQVTDGHVTSRSAITIEVTAPETSAVTQPTQESRPSWKSRPRR
jgi:PKD domain